MTAAIAAAAAAATTVAAASAAAAAAVADARRSSYVKSKVIAGVRSEPRFSASLSVEKTCI